MSRKYFGLIAAVVLIALAYAGFVTPGYVRYEHKMRLGVFGVQEIRRDRFTGKAQVHGAGGRWQPIEINGDQIRLPAGTEIVTN